MTGLSHNSCYDTPPDTSSTYGSLSRLEVLSPLRVGVGAEGIEAVDLDRFLGCSGTGPPVHVRSNTRKENSSAGDKKAMREMTGPVNRAAGLITFEVRCTVCRRLKYPTLPERPPAYVCVLCRSYSPAKRLRLAQAGRKGAAASAAKRAAAGVPR